MLAADVIRPVLLIDAIVVAPYLNINLPADSSIVKFALKNLGADAAVPVVFWFKVGNVQLVKVPDAGVPKFGVTKLGLVSTTNLSPVPVCEAIEVALPTEVITPVRLAFVVTVAAFPVVF
jgi:hypothetical protein